MNLFHISRKKNQTNNIVFENIFELIFYKQKQTDTPIVVDYH